MKFIIDAQLPIILKIWLIEQGFDVIHTRDLPDKNLTEDVVVMEIADKEN
jgi:predicted nuclease of predicted toxin-antitoxin system